MNNVMFAAMLGGWEILLILLVLLFWVGLVGGIVFLVVWLIRRGQGPNPGPPHSQVPPQPSPTTSPAMSKTKKFSCVEVRDGRPHIRWGVYFLGLSVTVIVSALLNGLLLAAGVWSGIDTVLFGLFVLVVVFNVFVIRAFNNAGKAGPQMDSFSGNAPLAGSPSPNSPAPGAPASTGRCPRCGAPLPANSPQGLCPRCVLGVGLATQTEATANVGPHGTKVIKPPPAPDEIGKHFPQLEILECLGRGGMGVVYKARQPKLNRIVALKILAPEKEADPKFAERFLREAQTLARLNHPNIVTVHDFGETDGLCYLLMEFVDGLTLRQMMRDGRMKPEEALVIVPRICEALQFAHEQGVVHRDIKPENVLLDKQGRVKIADFGIAKIVGEAGRAGSPLPAEAAQREGSAHGVTRPTIALTQDQALGTPHYMAPEQVEHPQTVDHRADIYSLGVVFYEMLTGELPLGKFQSPSKKVQVDVRLDEIVLRALEKEPALRYQQASVLRTDVETVAATPQSSSSSESAPVGGQRESTTAVARSNAKEAAIVFAGTFAFALLLSVVVELSRTSVVPLKEFFIGVSIVGLGICGLSLAGIWPFPSPWFPEPNFSSRNLRRWRRPPTSVAGPEPRFSRTAIVGACWSVFGILAAFFWLIARTEGGPGQTPTRLGLFLFATLVPLGITSLFGTTILGWIAVSRIRRSVGRLHGLGLAVFDGLLFPLLALDGFIGGAWLFVFKFYADFHANPANANRPFDGTLVHNAKLFALLLAVATIIPLNLWIIRRVWRAVNKPLPDLAPGGRGRESAPTESDRAGESERRLTSAAYVALFFTGLSGILGTLTFFSMPRPPQVLVWSILAAALFGILLATPVRRTRLGKRALIGGSINTAIWLIVAAFTFTTEEPLLRLTGIVTDAVTGKPIVSARVADNRYGADANKAPKEAWTDADGRYTLRTWPEEHTLAASAPGYETKLVTLTTSLWSHERKAHMDFQLQPTNASAALIFGPVIERVIQARQTGTNLFLDLDSGKLLSPTEEVTNAIFQGQSPSNPEQFWRGLDIVPNTRPYSYIAWLRESGADLMFDGKQGVIAFEGVFAVAHGLSSTSWNDWTGITPEQVRSTLKSVEKATKNSDSGITYSVSSDSPGESFTSATRLHSRSSGNPSVDLLAQEQSAMWFFKTREGGMGVLQITGFTDRTRGVKIRYKLVQTKSAASTVSRKPEPAQRKFVRLVVDKAAMTFEGQPTTWDDVGALMEKVPERKNTVLEFAVTSDQITVQQQNEWFGKCMALTHGLGFEYASLIGIHSLGSKGTPASIGDTTGATRLHAFGPVIERAVTNETTIDFDTGKLASPLPEFVTQGGIAESVMLALNWMEKQGGDALWVESEGLLCVGVVVADLDNDAWSEISGEQLKQTMAFHSSNAPTRVSLGGTTNRVSTYGFKTREGGLGLLQITGFTANPRGVKLRYKLVDTAPTKLGTTRPNPPVGFDPQREFVVTDFIDFDNGSLLRMPTNISSSDLNESIARGVTWMERSGADAEWTPNGLVGYGMTIVRLEAEQWNEMTLESLQQRLRVAQLEEPAGTPVMKPNKGNNPPATFGFQTREGRRGLLQVTDLYEQFHSGHIRYKLVQAGNQARQFFPNPPIPRWDSAPRKKSP